MEGSHEMEFAESANIQGSREILFYLGPFWSGNEMFLKLTNFSSVSKNQNQKEERNMSNFKIVGIMALIAFVMGILLVGDALAGERGKVSNREIWVRTSAQTLKVPDIEGHTLVLWEVKGIVFTEKWGACQGYVAATSDYIVPNRESTGQGYCQYTYPDGSSTIHKWESKVREGRKEGTWTYTKGTGRFEGIQGGGTFAWTMVGPDRWYTDIKGEYTLP
jgi:hypothetical protein